MNIKHSLTDLPLDLLVGQRGHDGAGLDVGAARGHVPRGHAHPQLQPRHHRGPVPQRERRAGAHRLAEQLVPVVALPGDEPILQAMSVAFALPCAISIAQRALV